MGMTDKKDSMDYFLLPDGSFYKAEEVFHENHRYIFKEGKKIDLEENSVWKSTFGYIVGIKDVQNLLALLDTAQHERYELRDSIVFRGEKQESIGSGYRHKKYGWVDYGLPQNDDCLCEYYRERIREKENVVRFQYNCGDSARKAAILMEWLSENTGYSTLSSSVWGLYVDLYFDDKPIRISQVYNGNFKVSWSFIWDGEIVQDQVLSPNLNLAVYRLLPASFKIKESLLEYKNAYALYRKILVGW